MSDSTPHHHIAGRPTFLSLPTPIRKKIYTHLLHLPELIYVFQDRGAPLSSFTPSLRPRPRNWTAILAANRQIYTEACETLYAENRFVIEEVYTLTFRSRFFEACLDGIGSSNSKLLADLSVTFPDAERGQNGGWWRVSEEGDRVPQRFRGGCTGLVRIEFLIFWPVTGDFVQADLGVDGSVGEVLSDVDAQLRGVESLEKIMLRVSSGSVSPSIREVVQRLEWVVH
ncbi:hypothetical protein BJX62DRAFT_233980 [Aspergillus germanicus]